MRPPEQPCQEVLGHWEHQLWLIQRGLFTPDHQEALPYDYRTVDRYHQDETGTWSGAESALANLKRQRDEYRYRWYDIYKMPRFSFDDYEMP